MKSIRRCRRENKSKSCINEISLYEWSKSDMKKTKRQSINIISNSYETKQMFN